MANSDAPMGLRPKQHINGTPWNGMTNDYYATDGSNIFIGDPVLLTGESYTSEFEGNPPGSLPIVVPATAGQGNQISGVVVAVQPTQATSTVYRAAGEGRIIKVCDDPDVLFQAQADGTVGDEAVGGGYNLIATQTGSTVTGRSGMEINSTTATGGPGAQLVVHRAVPDPKNDITAANSEWLVRISNHTTRSTLVVGDIE